MKLNALNIATLPPRKLPYADSLVSGLALYCGAKRRTWQVRFRGPNGKQKTEVLGYFIPNAPAGSDSIGLAAAREKAKARFLEVESGVPAVVAPPPVQHPKDKEVLTIGGMIDDYEKQRLANSEQKPGQMNKRMRGIKSLPKALKSVRSGLGDYIDLPAKEFTKFHMRAALAKIAGRGAKQMSDRFFSYANPIFEWAAKNDLVDHNPCAAVDKIGPGTTVRERVLSDDELRAIWAASFKMRTEGGRNYGKLIRFLMIVPLRLNEARLAVFGEFLGGRIRLKEERMKSAREFRLSLPDTALDILGQGTATERVFPKTQSLWRLKNELDGYCGVEHWRTHDLRRTVASRLQGLGVPLDIISAVLSHAAGKGADKHYFHGEAVEQKAAALELWAGTLSVILAQGNENKAK